MHSLPILIIFLSLFLVHLIHVSVRFLKGPPHAAKNLPPGPWKLPIIGNLHQLFGSNVNVSLRNLAKKYGPIMCVHLGETPAVVISSKEIAEHVLKTEGIKFPERPNSNAFLSAFDASDMIFMAPYGDSWRETRKIYTMELLSKNCVRSLKSARENKIRDFVESISSSSGKPINFSEEIYGMMFKLNHRLIFGKVGSEHCPDVLKSMFKEIIPLAVKLIFSDVFPSFPFLKSLLIRKLQSRCRDLLKKILMTLDTSVSDYKAERRAMKLRCKSSDERSLIDALLEIQERANEKAPKKDDQIISRIEEVFAAGTEASSKFLDWAMSELIRNPRVMAKAQAEVRHYFKGKKEIDEAEIEQLKYLKLIIKETLRLHPSPLIIRICRENCEILGYKIPEKTHILINAWALARDPNYWTNPDEFQPERFENSSISFRGINFEFLPFGAGRRMCPGITFAMANIELLLAQFLYHFDWKPANGLKAEQVDMTEMSDGVLTKRKNDLYLIASPAKLD